MSQDPQLGAAAPDWVQLLLVAMEGRIAEIHTGLPAKVVSFDRAKQSADVQPLIVRGRRDDDLALVTETIPVLSNVPVVFPAGDGWSITWSLRVGEIVELRFAERSLDRWKEAPAGDLVNPASTRKHDLSDAVAHAGLRPRTDPIPNIPSEGLRLANDAGTVVLELVDGRVNVVAATVAIGSADATAHVPHGEPLASILSTLNTALLALASTMTGIEGPATPKGIAWAALTTALAAVTAILAIPPAPGNAAALLSAKTTID